MIQTKAETLGKIDEVEGNVQQIEASNLETHSKLIKTIEGMGERLLKRIDDKIDELTNKIQQIEASNMETHRELNKNLETLDNETCSDLTKNVEGMGERLMKRIDDRIDELIARQDKIFQEMASSREQQNNTVNTFKQDASELIFKVNEVSEKIVDFEKNKRNNLILFGVPNDPHETPTSLDGKVWQLFQYIKSMCVNL